LDNLAIARILREIADLLEIKDDNPFKIRAYRNGADIAANHPHELATLDEAGLREIPGIGKDLAGRIREIGETGDTAYHRELVAEFPPTILDLLHLQGVGPKTVATLYHELDVRTIDDLERAALDGRVRALRGMGAKKEALILKALDERKRFAGRHLLPDAHAAAAALAGYLEGRAPGVTIDVISTPGLERIARFLAYMVKEVAKAPRSQVNTSATEIAGCSTNGWTISWTRLPSSNRGGGIVEGVGAFAVVAAGIGGSEGGGAGVWTCGSGTASCAAFLNGHFNHLGNRPPADFGPVSR